jgi:hypothetical protein
MSERMTEICCSNHYLQFAGKCSDVCVICDQRNRIAELEAKLKSMEQSYSEGIDYGYFKAHQEALK